MLPVVLGGAALLLVLAAGGGGGPSTGPGSGRVVQGPPPPPRLRIAVAHAPDPLLDAARKARAYVAAHPDQKPALAELAKLAHAKGRDDVAHVLS